jgi:hypothetical protein
MSEYRMHDCVTERRLENVAGPSSVSQSQRAGNMARISNRWLITSSSEGAACVVGICGTPRGCSSC